MVQFEHDTIVPDRESALTKKQQVAQMFDNIAFRYDFLNRFLSGGIDIIWRRKAINQIRDLQPKNILDVATGTADVALMTYKMLKPNKITGIDISNGMLELGRKKIAKLGLQDSITLVQADSESLPFADETFDAITVAFGVRNFEHLEKGMAEMLRVLKTGGKLVVLEFSKPKQTGFRKIYTLYMKTITPGLGRLFSGSKAAYSYLNDSVQAFPEGEKFKEILDKTGYKETYYKPLSLGICTIYCGSK